MKRGFARHACLLAIGLVPLWPRLAGAQQIAPVPIVTANAIARAVAVAQAPESQAPVLTTTTTPQANRPSAVMQSLYVTTAAVQALDAQSTFKAMDAGGKELNPLVSPLANNHAAFIALKAGMAAGFIYGAHTMSKHHKAGAIVTLAAINAVYVAIAVHNYHVVDQMGR